MNNRIQHFFAAVAAIAFTATSCTGFSEASDAEEAEPLKVSVAISIDVENLKSVKGLKAKLDDYTNDYHYVKEVNEAGTIDVSDVIPGIYTISVSGNAFDKDDVEYYVNGNVVNKAIYKGMTSVSVNVQGLKVSPLVFKEIYFAGSKGWYFRDQFYEVYNNSSEVQYLDGIYFAQLYPSNATTKLPVWKYEEDGSNCYGERVWKFPGAGTDYPLQPGESADNTKFPDQPAIDMVHVCYDGKAEKGYMPQFLTPVFGGAFALVKIPAEVGWDPVNKEEWKNYDGKSTTPKSKIPCKYVLDAVECVNNESYSNAKRIPAVIDAGFTWVGETYCGLGVARKVTIENGDTLRRENGAIIYQDTNNSTDDFERRVVPVMHRNGAGVPKWNVTYK